MSIKICYLKIVFRSRLPSIFIIRLPRNLRVDTTWRSATENGFRHVKKHVGMSQNATLARRNEATRRLETSKSDRFCRTRNRPGHTVLTWTIADGCERLRTQTRRPANTPSTLTPLEWNGNPCYAFRKILLCCCRCPTLGLGPGSS